MPDEAIPSHEMSGELALTATLLVLLLAGALLLANLIGAISVLG